jgi:hypothetical protein
MGAVAGDFHFVPRVCAALAAIFLVVVYQAPASRMRAFFSLILRHGVFLSSRHFNARRVPTSLLRIRRRLDMTPLDKVPGEDKDPSKSPDDEDFPSEWAEEDRVIEDRKPDLGEIEEDSSEL